jgi:nucleoside 2-deoxyribosyltransferase
LLLAEELKASKNSQVAFMAMPFNNDPAEPINQFYQKLSLYFEHYCNLPIRRIDHPANESNDCINDNMLAKIRMSKCLFADLSGENQGVYFEAGFAKGLGRNVFMVCHQDDFETHLVIDATNAEQTVRKRTRHFDVSTLNTKQYDMDDTTSAHYYPKTLLSLHSMAYSKGLVAVHPPEDAQAVLAIIEASEQRNRATP